jgi:hypothetical protein
MASLESIAVKREGGRGWHRIDKEKYDANPDAYVVCDENGTPFDDLVKKVGSSHVEPDAELTALRAQYAEKFGKKPWHGWDADMLRQKLGE